MTIREAAVADIPALAALATKTYIDAFAHTFSPDELEERVRGSRSEKYFTLAMTKDVVLVAEKGGEMIGYAEFGPADRGIETMPGDMELVRLYVREDFQRQGIGRALMHAVFAYPVMRDAKRVYLDVWEKSRGAIRLYESFGFVDTNQKDSDGDTIMVRDTGK